MTSASRVVDLIRGEGPERREAFMAEVFQDAFGELAVRDAAAFRDKFRKMASSALKLQRRISTATSCVTTIRSSSTRSATTG
jgi:hypothetical protein